MKILMLGWEFPPYYAGGVGMVCYELTKAMSEMGQQITFVMPSGPKNITSPHVNLMIADNIYEKLEKSTNVIIKKIDSLITPYTDIQTYASMYESYKNFIENKSDNATEKKLYGKNLIEEVFRFAMKLRQMRKVLDFDVIHAHDWTTFPAAIELKKLTKKPMFVHVHITEFDKTGGLSINQDIYNIEREGMLCADKVIAISHYVKNMIIKHYGIDQNKIEVVHNGGTFIPIDYQYQNVPIKANDRIVLYAGRVTLQKGPDYFVETAKKVCEEVNNVKFIMAGTGDMLPAMIDKVAQSGLSNKFIFTGFYNREQAIQLYNMADVFVMPSVSEPFGIVPIEAISAKTPTIISKQSGVAEILTHCFKVDFWDVDKMAHYIISLLKYRELHNTIAEHGFVEVRALTWHKPAQKCIELFQKYI